jgi:hypothetical protein
LAVTDDDHGGKTESPTTLDHRGTSLDLDDAIKQIAGKTFFLLPRFA